MKLHESSINPKHPFYPRECDECGVVNGPVVEIGEPSDHDSYTAYICADCLEKGLTIIRTFVKEEK